jgi:CRISP-associated protein Cas1
MLRGRLGLETARIPHGDRHGLLWLVRGNLYVADGTLRFLAAESSDLAAGDYAIPFQTVSLVLLGPGTTVSHDALRLLARHGTGLVAVGDGGVRTYSAPPLGSDESALARRQVSLWAEPQGRVRLARRMYAWRLSEVLPHRDITVLRGIEGARMKEMYTQLARQHGLAWHGCHYDRSNPSAADLPNQAINHAATAVESAAMIAVAATATVPQLGFVHEESAIAFVLDIADLFRDDVTLPIAFEAVRLQQGTVLTPLDRIVRTLAGDRFRRGQVISRMIDRIKELFDANDGRSDT